ncbi:MAG: hypothetical protein Q9191_008119, partial [Dirinaria sp. TL-2023a]
METITIPAPEIRMPANWPLTEAFPLLPLPSRPHSEVLGSTGTSTPLLLPSRPPSATTRLLPTPQESPTLPSSSLSHSPPQPAQPAPAPPTDLPRRKPPTKDQLADEEATRKRRRRRSRNWSNPYPHMFPYHREFSEPKRKRVEDEEALLGDSEQS